MRDGPQSAIATSPAPPVAPVAQDDSASAAPFDVHRPSHWLMRLGSPLGISLVLHGGLLLIFAAVGWAVANRAEDSDLEYEAKIIAEGPSGGPVGGYRFPGQALSDRPDAPKQNNETAES